MIVFASKEDFEFLKRLFEILVKSFLQLNSSYPEKNFEPIENSLNIFTKDFDLLWSLIEETYDYKSLNLSFQFEKNVTFLINKRLTEIDVISEQIYYLIQKRNISKSFRKIFNLYSSNSMIFKDFEKNEENLIL